MTQQLADLSAVLAPYLTHRRWFVAFSGGLDSHVLLHAICDLRKQALLQNSPFPEVHAIHVNHQLQAVSSAWVQHCQAQCDHYDISLRTRAVRLLDDGRGIESQARQARYQIFEQELEESDVLLMAHQDDQAETLLLRLLRGSGLEGLAAIPATRAIGLACLVRPLLEIPKAKLIEYAQSQGLNWIDDPSNQDTHYRRNFLRHKVMPLFAEHWPAYRRSFGRAAKLQSEAAALLKSYVAADLQRLQSDDGSLGLEGVSGLQEIRQRAILREFVLAAAGIALTSAQLDTLVAQFVEAGCDRQSAFVLGSGLRLRAYRGHLHCELHVKPRLTLPAELSWDSSEVLTIIGAGSLKAGSGGAFAARGRLMTVRFRRGGERCRLAGHAHSRPLKKLLQEWGIPTWQRDRLPLIYCGEELAAIADRAICEGFLSAPGEPGLKLHWFPESLTSSFRSVRIRALQKEP
jgi:tRNA(Ile)-lysidine synthase